MPRRPSRWGSVRVLSARTSAPAQGLITAEGPLDGADDDDELSATLARIWGVRDDRNSEIRSTLTPQLRATIDQTAPLAAQIARLAQANKALMGKVAPPQIESGDDDDQ